MRKTVLALGLTSSRASPARVRRQLLNPLVRLSGEALRQTERDRRACPDEPVAAPWLAWREWPRGIGSHSPVRNGLQRISRDPRAARCPRRPRGLVFVALRTQALTVRYKVLCVDLGQMRMICRSGHAQEPADGSMPPRASQCRHVEVRIPEDSGERGPDDVSTGQRLCGGHAADSRNTRRCGVRATRSRSVGDSLIVSWRGAHRRSSTSSPIAYSTITCPARPSAI